jgi:hypothetical protein
VCILDAVERTYGRYWTNFPRGRHVEEAMTEATKRTTHAANGTCAGGEPQRARTLAARVRASVANVNVPQKAVLLRHLTEIERACSGAPESETQ